MLSFKFIKKTIKYPKVEESELPIILYNKINNIIYMSTNENKNTIEFEKVNFNPKISQKEKEEIHNVIIFY